MNSVCMYLGTSCMPDLGGMYWGPVLPRRIQTGGNSRQVASELFSQGLCWEGPQDPNPGFCLAGLLSPPFTSHSVPMGR